MRGVFITGTGTSVGKTFISSVLATGLRASGVKVAVRKPIEQRCKRQGGALYPSDGLALTQAGGNLEPIDVVTPYRMAGTITPGHTAQTERGAVNLQALIDAVHAGKDANAFRVVEGAGGFLSPLAIDGSNADLAKALGFPVIVVAADRSGCVNHARLTVEAIQTRDLEVAAVVVNVPDPEVPEAGACVEHLSAVLEVPVVAHSHGGGDWDASMKLVHILTG